MNHSLKNLEAGTLEISRLASRTAADLSDLVHRSNREYIGSSPLGKPESVAVRAGLAGGLPFNTLTTDLVSGCLPIRQACYGMCFAARASLGRGIDFGIRVSNRLEEKILMADLERLPISQGYLRNGWNSDPSWSWGTALELARMVRATDRLTIFITKGFLKIDPTVLGGLVGSGAEIRVSLSAIDNDAQLSNRMELVLNYRKAGGVAVPILMSAPFRDAHLASRQEEIVCWLRANDLPAAENSLRFPSNSQIKKLVDLDMTRPIAGTSDLWSGRLFSDSLVIPTTTTVPDSYRGLGSGFLSRIDLDFVRTLYHDPVCTHEEVMASGESLRHPRQCGVPNVGRS